MCPDFDTRHQPLYQNLLKPAEDALAGRRCHPHWGRRSQCSPLPWMPLLSRNASDTPRSNLAGSKVIPIPLERTLKMQGHRGSVSFGQWSVSGQQELAAVHASLVLRKTHFL
jgi:hypothetical protein